MLTHSRIKICLIIIVVIGFLLRLWLSLADPFLHDWDERFHALVAENMIHHSFNEPMLVAYPVTDNYNPYSWTENRIWVHKQPLFLWQMALSMKIFGVSEWSMRLPSVIMGTLMILLTFRIALLLLNDKASALIAAFLVSVSFFFITVNAGIAQLDHNDSAFSFYVLASIWAYAEYLRSPRWYWAMLVGIFSGCAVLNKWLLGLVVYLGWGINLLMAIRQKHSFRNIGFMLLALIICCIVFLPWQLYVFHQYPLLAKHEMEFNSRHVTEALEGHSGSIWYYVSHFYNLYGNVCWILLPVGMAISIIKRRLMNKQLLFAFVVIILFAFCFFSFVVKTKSYNYLCFTVPLCTIFIAYCIRAISNVLKRSYVTAMLIVLSLFDTLNPIKIFSDTLSEKNEYRSNLIYNTCIFKEATTYLPPHVQVVMNVGSLQNINFMFYNNNITAYDGVLSADDMKVLESKKIEVAAFKNHGKNCIPAYVLNYPYLFMIDKELK